MTPIDTNLRQFATDVQWASYASYCEYGTVTLAAEALGTNKGTVSKYIRIIKCKAAAAGYCPMPAVDPELVLKGESILTGPNGELRGMWSKSKLKGRAPDEVTHLPDPKKIKSISTNYDQQGNVAQQWIKEVQADADKEKLWELFGREISRAVDRSEKVPEPKGYLNSDLLAVYPVGDHHMGMMAWAEETGGANYDIKTGEALLRKASIYLMQAAPACETCLIPFLGDFMHYDSFKPVTPEHGNLLDADSRFPKMVRASIRAMRHMITAALERHGKVHVIVEIGNHDLSSSVFLMECLHNVYENDPRVTIDTTPSHYHYFEWHKVLIGTHHGHGSKAEKLPGVMAHDRAEAWGRTRHRYWMTGHIHTRVAVETPGCSIESFNILAPGDAWSAQKGYRSTKNMKALIMHKDFGEAGRHVVNPALLGFA